ncbi:MAG: hypothetical protein RSC05_11955 [Acinetobacter sp.]
MALTTFLPTIWSARLLAHLDNAHVFANLVNREYEGEISAYGSSVKINQIGAVTAKKYTKNTDITAPEELSATDKTLTINQQDYFNFQVDDIDKAQARASVMDDAMRRAAYALGEVSDKFLANTMATGATIAIAGDTALTAANIYETMVKFKVAMDKRNTPAMGRWIVLPPEAVGLIALDQRFSNTAGQLGQDTVKNGWVSKAVGFDIYMSNNVPFASTGSKYTILAGTNMACSYAEQIVETEGYRMEKRFADAVKGLHVYGATVTESEAIYKASVTF